jgi:hydroxymethylbilane synthase
VDTRIRKVDDREYEAIVVAMAGLERLGLAERASQIFSVEEMVPSPGQGALAIQTRERDDELLRVVGHLEDANSRIAVTAERAVLEGLEAGCSLPVAAFSECFNETDVIVNGLLANGEQQIVRLGQVGDAVDAAYLGRALAKDLLAKVNAHA